MNLKNEFSLWAENSFRGLLKFPHTWLLDKIAGKEYFSKNLRRTFRKMSDRFPFHQTKLGICCEVDIKGYHGSYQGYLV